MSKLLIFIVRAYKKLSVFKRPTCRFYPTCSQYSLEAIEKYGPMKGILKGIIRILRCNQFNPGGVDPLI